LRRRNQCQRRAARQGRHGPGKSSVMHDGLLKKGPPPIPPGGEPVISEPSQKTTPRCGSVSALCCKRLC
jgi:hypothetical protein